MYRWTRASVGLIVVLVCCVHHGMPPAVIFVSMGHVQKNECFSLCNLAATEIVRQKCEAVIESKLSA